MFATVSARPGVALAIAAFVTACSGSADSEPALFRDVTDEIGLPGASPWPAGTFALPEIMGAGVGLFDYDSDGDLDILQLRFPPPGSSTPARDRLWRQESDGSFVDVTEKAGLGDGYAQGLGMGDVDNDGDVDVYVANFGRDALLLNNADGTFSEAPQGPGADESWSSAATFCDYDRDGDLDLYVVHYLRYAFRGSCTNAAGEPDYCAPSLFDGVADRLYRNDGGGTFTDVSRESGIVPEDGGRSAKGLGVVCADLTGDRLLDFYVANDGEPNQLWVNRGDGTFRDEGIMRGVAVNGNGAPEASMGVAVGDLDRNGELDLFVTHVRAESNTLYLGNPGAWFTDRTTDWRLGRDDLETTGFGCGFFDFDHDGDLDLALVNGRVYRNAVNDGARLGEHWNLYAEPDMLLANDGNGGFVDAGGRAGAFATHVEISRGLALGDLDNDGDRDLVVSGTGDGLRVFRNEAPTGGTHWLQVRALTGSRDDLGARVTVVAGDERFLGLVLRGYSYQSSSDPRAHFGLGSIENIDGVEIEWTGGETEWFPLLEVDRQWTLERGSGEPR